jgi:dipeptidase E
MKLLLTSAGYEEDLAIGKEFLKLVNKRPSEIKIFLVSTAEKGDEEWKWVKITLKELKKIGINPENVSIFSLNRKAKGEELKDVDVIYVCGGNTFIYLDRIRKTGLDKKIKEFVKKGGVYFGVSAGSYVTCPTIDAATWKHADRNTIGLKDLRGLNLVPFLVTAHFEKKYHSVIEKAATKTDYPIIALTDRQAVLVKGRSIKIIGSGKKNIFNTTRKF